VITLFLDWLAVSRQIYSNRGTTRYEIWDQVHGEFPREDAAEADLFRMLIRDLSTGGVIRQERETNQYGQFLRKSRPKSKNPPSTTMESAFEDTKPYVLTGLGEQFVHYTMNEVVTRIEPPAASSGSG
jgi:hypothetical protein